MSLHQRFALLGLLACGTLPAAAQEVTLKVHHMWTPNANAPQKIIKPWCERIAAESNHRMKCQIYPSMQLGGTPAQLYDQARDGVADIVYTLPGYTPGRFPVMEVFELPFMTAGAEAGSRAAWSFYSKYAVKEFGAVKPLLFNVHEEGYLHTRDTPVHKMEDLRGLKVRAPTRFATKLLTRLGATPVGMPLPSLPEAVSKGVVDGFLLAWEVIPSVKLQEMVKYHIETPAERPSMYTNVFVMAMNPARYAGLPDDLKAVIDRNSGMELSAHAGRVWDEAKEPSRNTAIARGNIFHTLPTTEIDRWIAAAADLPVEYVDNMNKAGLPGQAMLQDARALIAQHGAAQ
ncbi:TRAP transporter substrate-binding protein [Thauera aromatica]|uniref:Extracytoplasmic receptor TRAP type transport system n=1 Tax=Thauera aromatica TaxID=59405 RepID=A0A088S937_THAAR|nr:TRAP transporter substrate-binding protein [Thauera aromatica]AIO06089.1 extracytoplasmic receptor TRAP type transport system [Thauera aromatica]MCK2096951.1 TRAP transporter substrate-binding protein [Thauera aromatica]